MVIPPNHMSLIERSAIAHDIRRFIQSISKDSKDDDSSKGYSDGVCNFEKSDEEELLKRYSPDQIAEKKDEVVETLYGMYYRYPKRYLPSDKDIRRAEERSYRIGYDKPARIRQIARISILEQLRGNGEFSSYGLPTGLPSLLSPQETRGNGSVVFEPRTSLPETVE